MAPTFVNTNDTTLKKTENEVAAVLVHLTKLLRLKNWLCSPLLRLPAETIAHILSYIMEYVDCPSVWRPIFSTCHRIYSIMCTATELWWKIDCARVGVAHLTFLRSNGSPRVMTVDYAWNLNSQILLEDWRKNRVFHGHRLHTLSFYGFPSHIAHLSWIFEHPLPRLENLRVTFNRPDDNDGNELPAPDPAVSQLPVALQLPTDMPLRELVLRNITLPWSPSLFIGLRELCLSFDTVVEIPEDELLGILDASPQLEHLSLIQVEPRTPAGDKIRRERIVQLPGLAFLELETRPGVVGYILTHIFIPAITSLQVRSGFSPWDVAQSLDFVIPDDHPRKRLFSDPPVFKIETFGHGWGSGTVFAQIGGFTILFDFDGDDGTVRDTIVTRIQRLIPPSVTTLKIGSSWFGLDEWRGFLSSHPEVRSIEATRRPENTLPELLWDALSPSSADAAPLCPRLESISLFGDPEHTYILNCLRNRKNAGFKLKHLRVARAADELVEEFNPWVEVVEVYGPDESAREVCSVRWISFACNDWSQWKDHKFIGFRDEVITAGWSR